jgi:hypothetical protein
MCILARCTTVGTDCSQVCSCCIPSLPTTHTLHICPSPALPQLPRYILDEGKDLRIDGIIPTDAAPRGGFNAEGSAGKLKGGLDYPPVVYVAMQVRVIWAILLVCWLSIGCQQQPAS